RYGNRRRGRPGRRLGRRARRDRLARRRRDQKRALTLGTAHVLADGIIGHPHGRAAARIRAADQLGHGLLSQQWAVGSRQWAVKNGSSFTAHCLLPTANYFRFCLSPNRSTLFPTRIVSPERSGVGWAIR